MLSCLFACAAPAQALQFATDGGGLDREEAAASQRLLEDAAHRLPGSWAGALGTVRVEWRDDLPADVHGRALAGRMLLRRSLLAGSNDDADGAGRRAALAAVLHELAHLYDRTPQGRLSSDPRLLDLAGWQVAPLRPGRTRNAFTDRSPDPYELTDPVEFVAVNLEHFLLDPDYACRRPALHRHFAAHFNTANVTAACAPGFPFMEADADAAADPLQPLDPERVYAIDYLLAEGNAQPMSRWGHSMLRIVVCAPGRPRGPDCRFDLTHHRVLSFRAFVDDVQISSWRGLSGSYPSRLFLLPFDQVVDEYTKVELRGLQSVPLRLQQEEIAALLERAAQLHWSYDGRYYFLGNNCATETYKLLHDGVPRLAGAGLSSITPTGLLRRLARAGITDTTVLKDRAEAQRLGYYFESSGARYQTMFDVARSSLDLPQSSVQQWLDLPAPVRAAAFDRADLRAGAALLLLEQAVLRRQELRARDELKRRLLRGAVVNDAADAPARAAVTALLHSQGLLTRPALLLPAGSYGLPQGDERAEVSRKGRQLALQWKQQRSTLLARARDWLPAGSRAALDGTEANIASLGVRLRNLHRAQGGVALP